MLLLVSTLAQMEEAQSEAYESWDTYFNYNETHYVKAIIFNNRYVMRFCDHSQIREQGAAPFWYDSSQER